MRRTYVYDPTTGRMVEGRAQRKTESGDGFRFSDRLYSDNPFVGKDGRVIDSRKKHREYMRRHDLTTVDDFKGEWDKAAKDRGDFYQGKSREHHEDVKRDVIHAFQKRRSG